MAENREKGNPLGTVRRTIWFIIRAYLNEGLSVFNPSKNPGNSAYSVDFSLSKETVIDNYSTEHIHVVFTIKKITRTNEKKELVKNVKIEVAR